MARSVETADTSDRGPWGTTSRQLLARHILGSGLELGPGQTPFPAGPGTSVRVVDRWAPEENRDVFADWGLEGAAFVAPDIVADLNTDRLRAVADASQDFVICSHVLEHVADPIGLLADVHRVLRPGGVAMIYLPDRRRTYDRYRDGTTLAHLVEEHAAGVTEVDDEHLLDFLTNVAWSPDSSPPLTRGLPMGDTPEERRATLDRWRRYSVHVHCWTAEEFLPVLGYGIEHLGWRWEFVDGTATEDEGDAGIEFGFVLRVSVADVTSAALRDHLEASWSVWRAARDHQRQLGEATAAQGARLARIDASAPMRLYRLGKGVARRLATRHGDGPPE
jgi:SAM-dependent methyltransferase